MVPEGEVEGLQSPGPGGVGGTRGVAEAACLPHISLGGKDNFEVDREAAERVSALYGAVTRVMTPAS